MSKVEMLRALVKQRLTAAAEDIFGLFERTIAEYEETLCRSKEENERQRRLLDAVFNPQLRLHRADVQQLLVIKEEVPPEQQQEWSPSLDQEDPEPPHIKEEQEEVWTSQEGEQLRGLEEAHITKFTFTPVPVKNEEDDEEKPPSSQLHQRQTEQMESEADGEDCGGPEPDRNSHPDTHLQPVSEDNSLDSTETDVSDGDCEDTREPQSSKLHHPQIGQTETEADGEDCGGQTECRLTDCPDSHLTSDTEDKTGDSSETDVSDGDWEATREAQPGLNSLKNNDVLVSDGCPPDEKPFSCSVCCKGFSQKDSLIRHMTRHTGEKLFSCSVCERRFRHRGAAGRHMKIHTEEKPFSCSVCHKAFRLKAFLVNHMNIHTGEKPFSCSVCGRRFSQKVNVQTHMRTHTEEREAKGKPFSCSVCDKLFNRRSHFIEHMRRHTGEKPFICPVCHKAFCVKSILVTHMKIHTGEKPFSCSICGKRFTQKGNLTTHLGLHTKDSVDCESRQHIAESSSSSLASCEKLSPSWRTPTAAAANQSDPPTALYGINTGPSLPPHDGLWTFLQNRVVPEENIQNMQQDHVDTSLIRETDDACMAAYIPVYSDATGGDDPKRLSLFEKLRRKMETKTNHKDPDSEDDESYMKPIRTHLINNKRALKMTRRIELGWIHDKKQVRKRSGGGTRLVDISKKATKTEILSVAKTIFFPDETSRKGRWEEFSHDIVDFQEAYLDEGVTVGELYETHVRKLRFYLFTERLTNEVFDDAGRSHDQQKHITEDDEQMTHKSLDSQCWEFLYRSSHTAYP